jgi:uncharacterized protein (TIGR01244 family)
MEVMLILLALALGAAAAPAELPREADPAALPNYRLVRPGLATGGQPSPEGLASLPAMGFKTVISLRPDAEDPLAAKERSLVAQAGLRYVQVPVRPETFSLADVAAVQKVLDDPAASPVLLHCSSGNRVGALWLVMEVRRGRPLAEVQAEAEAIGLNSPPMREAAQRLIAAPPSPTPAP